MSASRAQQIMTAAGQGPFTSVFDFANKTKMTASELSPILDRLTTVTTSTSSGLVNVNTASATVLTAIGFDAGDAQTIVAARQGAQTNVEGGSGMSWLLNALPMSKLAPVGAHLTGRSYFYSADIVAVSGDGRAFKRVRIVVNARNTPAKIVYRKDMTEYGWPLDPQIRYSLRTGQGLPAGIGSSSSSLGTTR